MSCSWCCCINEGSLRRMASCVILKGTQCNRNNEMIASTNHTNMSVSLVALNPNSFLRCGWCRWSVNFLPCHQRWSAIRETNHPLSTRNSFQVSTRHWAKNIACRTLLLPTTIIWFQRDIIHTKVLRLLLITHRARRSNIWHKHVPQLLLISNKSHSYILLLNVTERSSFKLCPM